MSRRRLVPAILATLIGSCAVPAAASAVTCTFDPATRTLTVSRSMAYPYDYMTLATKAGRIAASDMHGATCNPPQATVTGTDRVVVNSHFHLTIDLSGGPLAPGFTPEADGSPEIEIEGHAGATDLGPGITVKGTPASNDFRAGYSSAGTQLNLNAGEATPDADFVDRARLSVWFRGGEGADRFGGRGGAGTGGSVYGSFLAHGEGGDDTLQAGGRPEGWSTLIGGPGNDTLRGSTSPSTQVGEEGDDKMTGGPVGDYFYPDGGNDTVSGGDGTDRMYFDRGRAARLRPTNGARVDLRLTGPQDTRHGVDTISGIDEVSGTGYPDVLRGSSGPETLDGAGGNDVLAGGGGNNTIRGSSGRDRVDYSDAPGGVVVSLWSQTNRADGWDSLEGLEAVTGSAYGDTLTGGNDADLLEGGPGPDTLVGQLGDDTLLPGSTASGKPDGADEVDGGDGLDTVSYAGRAYGVAVTLDGKRNDGADPDRSGASVPAEENDLIEAVENITGGGGADRLVAQQAGVNVLTGGRGADILDVFDGTTAVDRLVCGEGSDSYRADSSDALDGCETPAP